MAPFAVTLLVERDGAFVVADANEAACQFAGLPPEKLVGRTPGELGANAVRVTRDVRKALATGERVSRQVPYVRADGDVRYLELSYAPLGEGRALAFVQDTTAMHDAQERLRRSESRYRALISAANEGMWLVDGSGRTTFANGRVGRMLGCPAATILEGNLLDHVDERDLPVVAAALGCPLDTPDAFEARFRRSDGRELLCLLSVAPMASEGEQSLTLCVLADMTALQRERELRLASERRFRRMVETANEGIWSGDAEGNTTFANPAAARMVGLDPMDAIGLPFTDFVADREQAKEVQRELGRSGRPVRAELRLTRADGAYLDVIASLSLLRDDDGHVTGSLAMVTDVTQMKREQVDLRESRERFAQVFEEAPVGMAFLWAGHLRPGRLLGANRAFHELLGMTDDELVDQDLLSLTHPDDVEAERVLARELFEHHRDHYELEKRFVRPDGQVVWARFRAAVLRDARGAPLYGLGVAVDISAQKRAAADAARAGARARALLDATPEALIELDADGNATGVSRGGERLFGVSAADVVGKPFAPRFATGNGGERLAEALSAWRLAHAGAELEALETTLQRGDGSEFPAAVNPIPVAGGVLLHVVNLVAHERARAARNEAELRFSALFADSATAIAIVASSGRLVDVNPAFCRLAGAGMADLLGRDAGAVLVAGEDSAEAPWRASAVAGGPVHSARRVERPDGHVIPIHVIASPLRDSGGHPAQWICQCTAAGMGAAEPQSLPPGEALSYRERQVLGLLARGLDGPAIAERLGLSPETVRSYAQSAREKTGAKTRTEAVALALVRGEITV